jgi:TolB-like protein/Flp pilus assembly protein TadD
MASIISGYEYDIFISYRQKDNKYDGWVTEFVDNLKLDLESMFKDDVSVYFDINPSDYLLESHDVNASLKDKLRCLIFIPIISRTYCDPKSFAWDNELKAFINSASKDQFGLKIKLHGGNVANRVLPVRIHDLDITDTRLFESVVGGVMRSIDFVYKETGVNRQLRAKDDDIIKIPGQILYRDQINKVALAIKEIIESMKSPGHDQTPKGTKTSSIGDGKKPKNLRKNISDKSIAEISIAVLPFSNYTGDADLEWFITGQQDALYSELCKIGQVKPLRVVGTRTAFALSSDRLSIPEIARKINVEFLVEASVRVSGDSVLLQIRLIKAYPEEKPVFAETYTSDFDNIFKLYNKIAGQLAQKINLDLSPESLRKLVSPRQVQPESYKAYLRGMHHIRQLSPDELLKGVEYLLEAVRIDPGDPYAYAGLALGYLEIAHGPFDPGDSYKKASAAAFKAVELDNNMAEVYTALAELYLYSTWEFEKAEVCFKRALELNPNSDQTHYHYAWALFLFGRMEDAILEHKLAQDYDPFNPLYTALLGALYCYAGRYEEAIKEVQNSFKIQKDFPFNYWVQGETYLMMGKEDEAIVSHKKLAEVAPWFTWALGYTYALTNHKVEAEKILKELQKSETNNWNAVGLSVIYGALGQMDEAFKWLAYEPHHMWVPWVTAMPIWKPLRDDPRYEEFIRKFNFPK